MGNLAAGYLLLVADAPASGATGSDGGGAGGGFLMMAPILVLVLVYGYFLLYLPQKRVRQKQEQFMKNLKKNDRVQTIGGIVGTIVNIEPEGKVVTLKIDDNTRITFVRDAIQKRFDESSETPALKDTPK
jgi:preprotein translocase subunit YajC